MKVHGKRVNLIYDLEPIIENSKDAYEKYVEISSAVFYSNRKKKVGRVYTNSFTPLNIVESNCHLTDIHGTQNHSINYF
jgi:hypothetical protein